MIGRARTNGAISIVNALFDGTGGAVGIDLPLEIDVESDPAAGATGEVRITPAAFDTPVARQFIDRLLDGPGGWMPSGLRVRIRSAIPPACGLKSSSALATGLVLALAEARGRQIPRAEAARRAAALARATGQSATGAFDDCLAAVLPGIWITDNREDVILRHDPVPPGLEVVVWIPPGRHAPSPELVERFRGHAATTAGRLARDGRAWEALTANGIGVESVLGLEPTGSEEFQRAGARAAGVSGLGPARAIVVEGDRAEPLAEVLQSRPGRVLRVGFARAAPDGGTR
ncbi:MAG TPA: shikimate kinase [Thermoplasmata archaeon]|nr:shikimate kinase [Thermoplasmata archaeon]